MGGLEDGMALAVGGAGEVGRASLGGTGAAMTRTRPERSRASGPAQARRPRGASA
jgi:hypothetical protein